MIEPIEAFPLQWPAGFERSKLKKDSAFKCTTAQARDGVLSEIGRLKGASIVISSNVPVKKDGTLYASMKPVDNDEGVAVYFTWKNQQYVLACDNYYKIHENLRAIEKSIEAIRGLERWGVSDILSRAFTGFKALSQNNGKKWFEILEVDKNASYNEITTTYKKLAIKYHPDNQNTGDVDMFIKIKNAYDTAVK